MEAAASGGGLQRRLAATAAGRGTEADLAGKLAAFFDHDLAVADLAGDLAGGMDDELFANGQVAVEQAADLRDVDLGRALEGALLGNLHHAGVHRRLDEAFDHEGVA